MLSPLINFSVKNTQKNIIWLFNCPEGCQHILVAKKIKLHQINHIVITSLEIKNIAGIIGLLSSLSLNSRIKTLNIYGPKGLLQYLQFLKKYSQTNFKYSLRIHTIKYKFLKVNSLGNIYLFPKSSHVAQLDCMLVEQEKLGRFKPLKAKKFQIIKGPLYGKIKSQYKIISADGLIINSKYFTYPCYLGLKMAYLHTKYGDRNSIESTWNTNLVINVKNAITNNIN